MTDPRAAPPVNLARLPPLTALRAFVVASRHMSFTEAARELHVTPAAVGQQVRLLEDHLQKPLFTRARGRLAPTEAAAVLLPHLEQAFEHFLLAFSDLAASPRERELRVAVTPSFAAKWLMPRLERIREALPGLRIGIDASTDLADLSGGQVDCAIRYGPGAYPGLRSDRLFGEAVVPLSTPELAERWRRAQRLGEPADLTLLQEDGPERDPDRSTWGAWPEAGGGRAGDPRRTVRLGSPSLVLDAALAGQGIALGKLRLAEAELEAGRLVVPFGRPSPVGSAYHFAATPTRLREPHVGAFRQWLLAEAAASKGVPEGPAALDRRDGRFAGTEPGAVAQGVSA